MKASERLQASVHVGTAVSEVSLHLLVSRPHALDEMNTSLERALVPPLCTHTPYHALRG